MLRHHSLALFQSRWALVRCACLPRCSGFSDVPANGVRAVTSARLHFVHFQDASGALSHARVRSGVLPDILWHLATFSSYRHAPFRVRWPNIPSTTNYGFCNTGALPAPTFPRCVAFVYHTSLPSLPRGVSICSSPTLNFVADLLCNIHLRFATPSVLWVVARSFVLCRLVSNGLVLSRMCTFSGRNIFRAASPCVASGFTAVSCRCTPNSNANKSLHRLMRVVFSLSSRLLRFLLTAVLLLPLHSRALRPASGVGWRFVLHANQLSLWVASAVCPLCSALAPPQLSVGPSQSWSTCSEPKVQTPPTRPEASCTLSHTAAPSRSPGTRPHLLLPSGRAGRAKGSSPHTPHLEPASRCS
ncbi:hypothetical protein C8R47DRAFT_1129108 [Mycena vitilis]|nr:hypothetical protein C8R47DRAFT_1129108 [Mycena vitilis]